MSIIDREENAIYGLGIVLCSHMALNAIVDQKFYLFYRIMYFGLEAIIIGLILTLLSIYFVYKYLKTFLSVIKTVAKTNPWLLVTYIFWSLFILHPVFQKILNIKGYWSLIFLAITNIALTIILHRYLLDEYKNNITKYEVDE